MHAWQLALRTLRRRLGLTVTVVLTGAIAVSALAVTGGLADPILLRPLPYPEAARLVLIHEIDARAPGDEKRVSPADFHEIAALHQFESSAAWMNWNFNLTGAGLPQRLVGALVSEEFFETLGVQPHAGRWLSVPDAQPGAPAVAVISHRLWRETFAEDPALVGKTIRLGGDPVEIVAIMPPSFHFPDAEVNLWTPLVFGVHFPRDDAGGNLRVVARLREDVPVEGARDAVGVLSARLAADHPRRRAGRSLAVMPLREALTGGVRPMIVLFGATAAALLLIAMANTANLLLMLTTSRQREIATQAAIGASARGLVLQALVQALAFGIGIAAVSLLVAGALLPFVDRLGIELPFPMAFGLDARVVALTIGASLVTALGASVVPAWLAARTALAPNLPARQTQAAGGGLRSLLVLAQVAMACALLVTATLLGKSLLRLVATDPGFDARNVITARVWLPSSYPTSAEHASFFAAVLERLERLPGVDSAGAIQDLPLRRNAMRFPVMVANREEAAEAAWRVVDGRYFETMRIPILRGRPFGSRDVREREAVAIVNRAAATRLFGSADPIGRRIRVGEDGEWAIVVGIAGDVRHRGLAEEEIPAVYEPMAQKQRDFLRWMTLVVRTGSTPSPSLATAMRAAVMAVDPAQPVYEIAMMDEMVRRESAPARVAATLVGGIGVAALLIALVGTAGVLSYAIALRRRELAIRSSIGAEPRAVVMLVLRDAIVLGALGGLCGLLLASWAAPLIERLLFETPLLAAEALAVVALILTLVVGVSIGPARRAAAIDPASVLRAD